MNCTNVFALLTLLLFFITINLSHVQAQQDSRDNEIFTEDKITEEELVQVAKLRDRVKSMLTQKVMFENHYLVRYLRVANHDLNEAEKVIRKTYQWRQHFNADHSANYSDWTAWFRQYPFRLAEDKSHRPALVTGFRDFDLRKTLLTGKLHELRQYIIFILDKSVTNLDLVAKLYGKEYVSGYLVFDLNGYNPRTYACLACLSAWVELAVSYEAYYPHLAYKVIGVNAPKIFQNVFSVMEPFLSKQSQNLITLYGYDRLEWQTVLFTYFDKSQLTKEFGGTLEYDIRLLNEGFYGREK